MHYRGTCHQSSSSSTSRRMNKWVDSHIKSGLVIVHLPDVFTSFWLMRIKIAVAVASIFPKHAIDTNRLPTSFHRNIEIDMFKLNLTHEWLRLKAFSVLPNVHDVMHQQLTGRPTRQYLVGVSVSNKLFKFIWTSKWFYALYSDSNEK